MKNKLTATTPFLVSVIVPIFNVDKYISTCIDSIISQNYKNIEIILVNDGSTDRSGIIAESYSGVDKRITVLHQENSGVSAARNAALEIATGDYVCFIDADDWIAKEFVSHLLELACKYEADLVFSRNVLTEKKLNNFKKEKIQILNAEQTTETFLHADVIIGSWNKLFKRSIIEENKLRFLSRYFMGEGLNFISTFAQLSKNTVATDKELYFYRRDNFNSATTKINIKKMKNAIEAIDNIKNNLIIDSHRVLMAIVVHRWATSLYSLRAIKNDINFVKGNDFYDSCVIDIKNNSFRVLVAKKTPLKKRFLALLVIMAPALVLELNRSKA